MEEIDLLEIKQAVMIWFNQENRPIGEGIRCVEDFTVLVCGTLHGNMKNIEKFSKETGLSGYISWVKEKMNQKE